MPPPEPAVPTRRPLRRSASDKVIAGVAGGLAENFGVSSLAVRTLFGLAFVVIAWQVWTLLGIAIVAYVLLWIFVPREDIGVSPAGRLTRRFPRIGPAIGVLVLLGGAAAIAAQLDAWLVWPVLLIGLGVLLYRHDAGRVATAVRPVPRHRRPRLRRRYPPRPSSCRPNLAHHVRLANARRSAGSGSGSRCWWSASRRSCRTSARSTSAWCATRPSCC